jgi:hypothetical protein
MDVRRVRYLPTTAQEVLNAPHAVKQAVYLIRKVPVLSC